MTRLHFNNVNAALGAALGTSGGSITFAAALTYNNGTAVPTIGSGDYLPLTILTSGGYEIVWLTAYASGATTGTILRGQEGTAAVAHASGDALTHALTSTDFNTIALPTQVAVSGATASSNFSSEPPANAIDNNTSTSWTTNGVVAGWLRLALSTAAAVNRYTIARRDDVPARNPRDFTFEGSNDGGTTWTALDTRSAVAWPTAGEIKIFDFNNTTAYAAYRLNITNNVGNGSESYTSVTEIKIFSVVNVVVRP